LHLDPDEELRGLTVTWALALPMMAFHRAANPNVRMEQCLPTSLKAPAGKFDAQLKAFINVCRA
jgi:hypothetical protein